MKNFNRYHHFADLWNNFLKENKVFTTNDVYKNKLPYGSIMLSILSDKEYGIIEKTGGFMLVPGSYIKKTYVFVGNKFVDHTIFEVCKKKCINKRYSSKAKINIEEINEQKGSSINQDRLNELSLEKITRLLLSHPEYNSEKFLTTYFMPEELAYALRHHGYTLTATKLIEL